VAETTTQKLFPGERPRYPELWWESQCTQDAAKRFMEDVTAVITQLQTWGGLDTRFLFAPEEGSSIRSAFDQITGQRRTGKKKPPRK
jgi:hypothetical protein